MSDAKKTRDSWEIDETHYFLRLINEKKVLKSLDGKRFRGDEIFVQLVPKMEELGYTKTARQLQTKFRTLREKYNKVMKVVNSSGEDTITRRKFVFFDEMHALLSERPVQNLQFQEESGIDSTDTQRSEDTADSENWEITNEIQENTNEDSLTTNIGSDDTCTSIDNASTSNSPTPTTSRTSSTSMTPTTSTAQKKYRPRKRTYQETIDAFAETNKKNLIEVQTNLLNTHEKFINECLEKQHQWEKDLFKDMMATQRRILQETTATLVSGMQSLYQIPPFYGPPGPSSFHAYPTYPRQTYEEN